MNHVGVPASELTEIFRQELKSSPAEQLKVLLFVHRQADPDALCAASGLGLLLRNCFPDTNFQFTIIAPQGASSLGLSVCARLGIEFKDSIDSSQIQTSEMIVALDTGDLKLLEPYAQSISTSQARKFLIDHHASSKDGAWPGFDRIVVDSSATSTCEIIVNGFSPEELEEKSARILLVGLLFDSQHLGIATASTLTAALSLVNAGAEIDTAKRVLRSKPDRSETIARIKSAQRLQYEEFGSYILLKAEVSSFHAAVARMLLEIGGDVGIAYGESNGEARLSIRSNQSFYKETGIDLSAEAKSISVARNLLGGGHATAASLSGNIPPQELASEFISLLKAELLKK